CTLFFFRGLQQYMAHLGMISVTCQFLFPHIEMEALNIVPILEDGTVRLRWRVKHISLLRALTNPMLFRYDYRVKRLKWFDGYSIFVVDGDGLVYKVVNQKVMPDEERGVEKKSATQRLVEKMGVLPKGAQAAYSSVPSRRVSRLQ
uniref:Uncharacterized protein n=1 Tax=Parascaris univalens TaxID=6257 RepID=A0A915AAQ8_PARUN